MLKLYNNVLVLFNSGQRPSSAARAHQPDKRILVADGAVTGDLGAVVLRRLRGVDAIWAGTTEWSLTRAFGRAVLRSSRSCRSAAPSS
jgi:hypothetical protein